MKKYTDKILIITLILIALMMIIVGSVEIRKSYHSGEIMTIEELQEKYKDADKIIVYSDSVAVDNETEKEQ